MKTTFTAALFGLLTASLGCSGPRPVTTNNTQSRLERQEPPEVKQAREARRQPVTPITPLPAKERGGPLLIGDPDELGPDGYPTAVVDKGRLRDLLIRGRFDELNRHMVAWQDAFEANHIYEYWALDAAMTFSSPEPEFGPKLDAWIAYSPGVFAPYLARSKYRVAVGYALRGAKWVKDTPQADLDAMERAFAEAPADIVAALQLRPKAIGAYDVALSLAQHGPPEHARALLDEAVGFCPKCVRIRVRYLDGLRPRWGGSHEQMRAFAAALGPDNPRFRYLPGYVDLDLAHLARSDRDYPLALKHCNAALELAPLWPPFLKARARVYQPMNKWRLMFEDASAARRARPNDPEAMTLEARALTNLRRSTEAAKLIIQALRIDPTNSGVKFTANHIVDYLIVIAKWHQKGGRHVKARSSLELASAINPTHKEAHRLRESSVAALGESSADDLHAYQQRDYALARQGKFDAVIEMWDGFIARHPEEGAAYLERGGAYFQTGRLEEAHQDAAKACELGVPEGCARVKQLESK